MSRFDVTYMTCFFFGLLSLASSTQHHVFGMSSHFSGFTVEGSQTAQRNVWPGKHRIITLPSLRVERGPVY